jgi:hypothetical protein
MTHCISKPVKTELSYSTLLQWIKPAKSNNQQLGTDLSDVIALKKITAGKGTHFDPGYCRKRSLLSKDRSRKLEMNYRMGCLPVEGHH